MHDVDTKTNALIMTMLSEPEMKDVNDIISNITSLVLLLGRNLNRNTADSKLMIKYLKDEITTYEFQSYETSLIEFLDTPVVNSTTIINLFIERLQTSQLENSSKMRSSTNKLVHEFYTWVMLAVSTGQSYLELCYNLNIFYTGGFMFYCIAIVQNFNVSIQLQNHILKI